MTRPRKPAVRHGYVVIDKPAGWTSHDVVARVRRIVDEKRVGHAGTLDPAAVGVLPIAIGNATKTIEYLADADKTYIADITLGRTTDSFDIEGTLIEVRDTTQLSRGEVERALTQFRGPQLQRPPMHSAIKIDGQPLYERARKGEEIEVPSRPVIISSLKLLEWNSPVARVEIRCSKGTYVRSLARDIGELLGTGAFLSRLVRTRVGGFDILDATSLTTLDKSIQQGHWDTVSWHPDVAMLGHPALILNASDRDDWLFGRTLQSSGAKGIVRVYDSSGHWLGVGEAGDANGQVRPVKVVPFDMQESA